ncbi:unnamed protein product [Natator depressus]
MSESPCPHSAGAPRPHRACTYPRRARALGARAGDGGDDQRDARRPPPHPNPPFPPAPASPRTAALSAAAAAAGKRGSPPTHTHGGAAARALAAETAARQPGRLAPGIRSHHRRARRSSRRASLPPPPSFLTRARRRRRRAPAPSPHCNKGERGRRLRAPARPREAAAAALRAGAARAPCGGIPPPPIPGAAPRGGADGPGLALRGSLWRRSRAPAPNSPQRGAETGSARLAPRTAMDRALGLVPRPRGRSHSWLRVHALGQGHPGPWAHAWLGPLLACSPQLGARRCRNPVSKCA